MNVTQLRAFISVVETGSFSAAAKQAGVSQPAVTMQIKALEADVGATLIERGYHRIDLTEAGRALLPHAKRVLEDISRAREDIASLSHTLTGRLAIAASTVPGEYVIPRLLGVFLERYPQVQVEIAVSDSAIVVDAVESGRADVGVCGVQIQSAKVAFEEAGHDELVVICAPGHPLASRGKVPFAALAESDWVGREAGSGTGQVARQALAERGIDPDELRVLVELGSGDAVVSAVEGGLGVAIVSAWAAEKALALGTVKRVDMEGEPILRPLYLVLPKRAGRAAAAFAGHVRESVAGDSAGDRRS